MPIQQQMQIPEVREGMEAYQQEDWETAATKLQAAIAKGVRSGRVSLYAGYSLHRLKRYEEALPLHLATAASQNVAIRIDALYNAACAHAMLGHADDAMKYLALAADAGLKDVSKLRADTDLDSLRTDPRFQTFLSTLGSRKTLHQSADFLVGVWSVQTLKGEPIEDMTIARPMDASSSLLSTIITPQRRHFAGMLIPIAADRTWQWNYGDDAGSTTMLVGTIQPDGGLQFVGRIHSPAGPGRHLRLTYTPILGEGLRKVRELAEISDDGQTWRIDHEALLVPPKVPSSN